MNTDDDRSNLKYLDMINQCQPQVSFKTKSGKQPLCVEVLDGAFQKKLIDLQKICSIILQGTEATIDVTGYAAVRAMEEDPRSQLYLSRLLRSAGLVETEELVHKYSVDDWMDIEEIDKLRLIVTPTEKGLRLYEQDREKATSRT